MSLLALCMWCEIPSNIDIMCANVAKRYSHTFTFLIMQNLIQIMREDVKEKGESSKVQSYYFCGLCMSVGV